MRSEYEKTSPQALVSAQSARILRDTPWKAFNMFERLLLLPIARLSFAWSGIAWQRGWRLYGLPIIQRHRASTLTIGEYLQLRSTARSNPLGANHPVILSTRRPSAVLEIGHHFSMTGGSIIVEEHITIGNYVTIGCNCTIMDTDFHPLDPAQRRAFPLDGATAPIVIADNVFIGMNTLVLKGVTIGENSVIGAGSLIIKDIPPNVIAAGHPARVVRELPRSDG